MSDTSALISSRSRPKARIVRLAEDGRLSYGRLASELNVQCKTLVCQHAGGA